MKKIISAALSTAMLLSAFVPMSAVAAEGEPTLTVQSTTDNPGAIVDIPVTIENNPGILGATIKFTYDSGLTLVDATAGDAFSHLTMTKPGRYASPCNFTWDGMDLYPEDIKDGTVITLSFSIDEDAEPGTEYRIRASYGDGDIVDGDLNPLDLTLVDGIIKVVDYIPGDLDGNEKINSTDVIMLRRYIAGGYDVSINEAAGDVNADSKHNSTDVIMIRRFIAGGYDVELLPSPIGPSKPKCNHVMTAVEAKAPTCTEDGNVAYWHCEKCDKYFSDEEGKTEIGKDYLIVKATGHTIEVDEAVAPTYDSTGLTEGAHCSVCEIVLVEQEVIPKLQKEEYSITYYISNNDPYLMSLGIENPNPSVYAKEDGLILDDIIVDGYNFLGWYTAQSGGSKVTEISVGETGNKVLYAHWEKVVYTIQFDSEMVPIDTITYTAGQEVALPKPVLDKYTFVGWSRKVYYKDDKGEIKEDREMLDEIPAGTIGNLVLYANWASNRNKAEAKKVLGEPLICEDTDNGKILFAYEIGAIRNVPLYTTLKLNCANGIITTVEKTNTVSIDESNANRIAKSMSSATTNSTAWTLSSDWNKSTEVSQSFLDQTGMSREEAETLAKSESNTYNVGQSYGGSSTTANTSNGSFKYSENNGNSFSATIGTGTSAELEISAKVGSELSGSLSGSVPGVGKAEIGAKVSAELGTNEKYGQTINTSNTGTNSWSNNLEVDKSYSNTSSSSKSWNTSSGYENSKTTSESTTVSNVVSQLISEQYGYGETYQEGGSNSQSRAEATTDSQGEEFSSTIEYHTGTIGSKTESYSSTGNTKGGYRMVMAGTVHVFAVVGYDVATSQYSVYTYNVLGDGSRNDAPEEYLDYSFNETFNDYETSVIPFEVPYFVEEYVNNRIAKTDGIKIDPDTGIITRYRYTGDEPDKIVVIPSYIALDNNDSTFTSVKVKGIAPGLFKDNTDIIGVQLGNFITEIPDSAFEGCSSLKYVLSPGVTRIGDNAFSGCELLESFAIPADITELGENAFEGVPDIKVTASNTSVAQAAASSNARNVVLDISTIPSSESRDMTFEIGTIDSFELQGRDKEYKGLSLKSDAGSTIVNGVTFTENTKIPLELSSSNVTLDRVTVDCNGYALVLKADETNILLNRSVGLISSSGNAIVSRSVSFDELSSDVVGKLNITGNMLVCGEVNDNGLLTFTDGEIIYLTEEEYENYLTSHYINFDVNGEGATVSTNNKLAAMNMPIGELPEPRRDFYTFEGWYTEPEDGDEEDDGLGDKITEDTLMTSLTDITLYAHWVHNDVSEWVLVSDMPADAEVAAQKWSYTLTSYTTSNSSTMSGWERYDSTWEWGPWGSWSGWQTSNPGESESRQREWSQGSNWVDTSYNLREYHYYHWSPKKGWYYTTYNAAKNAGYSNAVFREIWLTYELPWNKYSGGMDHYGPYDDGYLYFKADGTAGGASPYVRDTWISQGYTNYYDLWRYRDRSKVYTYYFRKYDSKESSSYPTGDNISNVQEYVQYRTK